MKLIDGHAMIRRVEALHKRGTVDLSYYNIVKEAVQMEPAVDDVPVVRCRDCKHRPIDHREEYNEMTGFGLEFPDDHCPCQCEDGWYSWYPSDDWFCADGERRDSE